MTTATTTEPKLFLTTAADNSAFLMATVKGSRIEWSSICEIPDKMRAIVDGFTIEDMAFHYNATPCYSVTEVYKENGY